MIQLRFVMNDKVKKHYTEDELFDYLLNKHYNKEYSSIKNHIDSCAECWDLWNKVRWDAAADSKGILELKEYLGDGYTEYFDSSWAIAEEWNDQNPQTPEEIADFYKTTNNYLFNLVVWHESGDREPFFSDLKKLILQFNIESVIDYGCGVGTDSLSLAEYGIKTYMVDYESPTSRFLRWRLKKRNLKDEFVDVEKIRVLPDAELFWAIDVLEHLPDPSEVLGILSQETKVFVHRSQFNDQAGGRHPCHIINFEEKKFIDSLISMGFVNIPWNNLSVWVKKDLL